MVRHAVEDASLSVEAGFRAVAPCLAVISKNSFENQMAAYEIHMYSLSKQRFHFANCEMAATELRALWHFENNLGKRVCAGRVSKSGIHHVV